MAKNIVFTLTGTDRVGIVDEVTKTLLELGGNIETSKMTRLGGEFAVLLLITLPDTADEALRQAVARLTKRGYKVTTTSTDISRPATTGWLSFRIEVQGADHEGIVNSIAHTLAQRGISIEAMETGNTPAPNSGIPLFHMNALVLVPPELDEALWQNELELRAAEQHVDVTVRRAS
jgi:glycine cleavage system transcriptional repressor